MADALRRTDMTVEEFLAWNLSQDERFELVDGQPVALPIELGALEVRNPIAAIEVLSPTTRQLDRSEKLQEYLRHPSLKVIVHIDPGAMDVMVYARDAGTNWDASRLNEPDDTILIPGTDVALSLAAVYDGIPVEHVTRG